MYTILPIVAPTLSGNFTKYYNVCYSCRQPLAGRATNITIAAAVVALTLAIDFERPQSGARSTSAIRLPLPSGSTRRARFGREWGSLHPTCRGQAPLVARRLGISHAAPTGFFTLSTCRGQAALSGKGPCLGLQTSRSAYHGARGAMQFRLLLHPPFCMILKLTRFGVSVPSCWPWDFLSRRCRSQTSALRNCTRCVAKPSSYQTWRRFYWRCSFAARAHGGTSGRSCASTIPRPAVCGRWPASLESSQVCFRR